MDEKVALDALKLFCTRFKANGARGRYFISGYRTLVPTDALTSSRCRAPTGCNVSLKAVTMGTLDAIISLEDLQDGHR